jgi:hypothetical protein
MSKLINGGLYLLREREFIKSNETIYKIGRSDDVLKRVNQYPNGSIVYLIIGCDNNSIHETKLIELFNNNFSNENYIGTEYFNGDVDTMKNIMLEYIKSKINNFYLIDNEFTIERVNKDKTNIPKINQQISNIQNVIKNIIIENKANVDNDKFEDCIEEENNEEENNEEEDNENNNETVNSGNEHSNSNINVNINNNNGTVIINNNSDNRTCSNCGIVFLYPCHLERHNNGKRKCKPKKIKKQFICIYCEQNYSSRYNLERHSNTCKEKIKKETQNNIIKNNINNNNNEKVILELADIFKIAEKSGNLDKIINIFHNVLLPT